MPKFFNKEFAIHEIQGHMTIMEGDKPVELPIVKGVVNIPDALYGKATLGPGWVPYVGQVESSNEKLQPLENVDAFYNPKSKKPGS